LIAGKFISSGRKFILKVQEDWAYKKVLTRPGEGLKLWFGLRRREEMVSRK
jgi:hypothetical protein